MLDQRDWMIAGGLYYLGILVIWIRVLAVREGEVVRSQLKRYAIVCGMIGFFFTNWWWLNALLLNSIVWYYIFAIPICSVLVILFQMAVLPKKIFLDLESIIAFLMGLGTLLLWIRFPPPLYIYRTGAG